MASAAVIEIVDYPMKIDDDGSLICDMSKLENHLIQQQNSEQQNYSQHDVTELTVFLTEHKTQDSPFVYIRVLLDNHTVNDVTLQAAAVFYISAYELGKHHHHPNILRMILQCTRSEDRVRLLHTQLSANGHSILHLIAGYDKTGETMKIVLELINEDQYYHLLSVQTSTRYQETPLHSACQYNNSAAVLEVIMRLVTSEQTRYKLLQIPNSGNTPLHYAASRNATQAIRIIADSVSSHHLIHLLTVTDKLGRTPLQKAAQWDKQEAVKLLQEYHTTANLIVRALQQTDYTGK